MQPQDPPSPQPNPVAPGPVPSVPSAGAQPAATSPPPAQPAVRVSVENAVRETAQALDQQQIGATNADTYSMICTQIIRGQEQIIGVLALERAALVDGLHLDPANYQVTVTGNGPDVVNNLIKQYQEFFGHAAVEVCKEAAGKYLHDLPQEQRPSALV